MLDLLIPAIAREAPDDNLNDRTREKLRERLQARQAGRTHGGTGREGPRDRSFEIAASTAIFEDMGINFKEMLPAIVRSAVCASAICGWRMRWNTLTQEEEQQADRHWIR